jgi:cell fate regulator YaaT (PSP1 superfamily)
MLMVGEFPYDGSIKPGCGSKLVLKTHRGTELGEMLTSTCANSGCSKSVSRKEMLQYIENSGGRDYPFFQEGRVLRVATPEDLDAQARLEQTKHELRLRARAAVDPLRLPLKIVEVEPLLGGERLTVHYVSEERVDLTGVFRVLQQAFPGRLDIKHVGPRDEARLNADYEKCGQYCCCKNFLKVLKPVSMKNAKVQKATLDPLKISGRCGRLMCCLRYEEDTYEDLRKRLPHRKVRVGTPDGDGIVMDTQILTQLVLVRLDALSSDGKIQQIAFPLENLTDPRAAHAPDGSINSPNFRPAEFPPPRSRGPDRPSQDRPPQGRSPDRAPQDRPRRDDRPDDREPRPEPGPGDARPDRPQRPPQRSQTPRAPQTPRPSPPRDSRPPAPPPAPPDELDEIMRSLDEDDAPSRPEGGPDAPGAGQGRGRRRRRRRRGGPGNGPGGPPLPPSP